MGRESESLTLLKENFLQAYNAILNHYGVSSEPLEAAGTGAFVKMDEPELAKFPPALQSLIESVYRGIPIRLAYLFFHPAGAMIVVEPTTSDGYRHRSGELVSPQEEVVAHPAMEFHLENMTYRVFREPYAQHERAMDPLGSNIRLLMTPEEWTESVHPLTQDFLADLVQILKSPESLYRGEYSTYLVSIQIFKMPQDAS